MKKKALILCTVAVVICAAVLASVFLCNDKKPKASPTKQTQTEEVQAELKLDYLAKTDDWKTKGLKKAGLDGVDNTETLDASFGTLYVLVDSLDESIARTAFLAVETKEKILFKELDTMTYSEIVYVCDIDGLKGDEIVVQACNGMSGGAGNYVSYVFKVDNYIKTIFYSNSLNDVRFETGFVSKLQAPFEVEIYNYLTDKKTVLNCKDRKDYIGTLFKKNGKPIDKTYGAMFDSFYEFKPKDIDNDGVYELICKQYTSLYNHSDYIGTAKSVLKYDKDYNFMRVVDSSFIPDK